MDDIVSVEQAVLLTGNDSCEISLSLNSNKFKIGQLSLVTTVDTLEVFTGNIREYLQTCRADFIDDFEEMKTFRFDITFDKTVNSNTLTLKVCIIINCECE